MKFIAVPILILLIATQAFSKWVILLEFQWNKEYIAQNLCENKAKPKLKCEGKCQLAKKMAEEEKESSSQTPNLKIKFHEILFADKATKEQILPSPNDSSPYFTGYLLKSYSAPIIPVFHPPA